MDEFEPNELFVYVNGDRWELGQVKRKVDESTYACWYSTGDTAARTPVHCMHKLANAGWSHVERVPWYVSSNDEVECPSCGYALFEDEAAEHGCCPNCGHF